MVFTALLIVASLVFLLSINPLGVFSSTSITLEKTNTIIKEINSIGELVTSEYYGEVLESLEGKLAYTAVHYQYFDSAKTLYQQIKESYSKVYERYPGKLQKSKRKQVLFADSPGFEENDVYLLLKSSTRKNDKLFLNDVVKENNWDEFQKMYSTPLKERIGRSVTRKSAQGIKLAYVGRGWVKAGFDFSDIGTANSHIKFEYNTAQDTLYIRNLDPEILDADINPWFIFNNHKKVKGFEVLKAAKNNSISFEDITTVKKACKEKLRQDAIYRDIFDKAITSAEETLSSFINLLARTEGKSIVVKIIPTPYFRFKKQLIYDHLIDTTEIRELRSFMLRSDSSMNLSLIKDLLKSGSEIQDEALWKTEILGISLPGVIISEEDSLQIDEINN